MEESYKAPIHTRDFAKDKDLTIVEPVKLDTYEFEKPTEEEPVEYVMPLADFNAWLQRHGEEMDKRFGQNPDIDIRVEGETIIITERPSKTHKASLIEALKEEA